MTESNGQPANIFDLNPNKLDTEWVQQPKLFYQAAEKLAEAKAELEKSKTNKDIVMAELDRNIRAEPDKFSLSKVTEPVVEQTIILQGEYKKAQKRFLDAKHNVDIAQVVVDTLDHRKSALENLVKLRLANYYAEPRSPQGKSREEVDELVRPMKRRTREDG